MIDAVLAASRALLAVMLLYGGLEDWVEIARWGTDAVAGRYGVFVGDQELLGSWEMAVVVLDAVVSSLLAIIGMAFLRASRKRDGLLAGAFLVAIGVVDELSGPLMVVADVYFGSYFTLFFTAFLLMGSSFPSRLTVARLDEAFPGRRPSRLDRAFLQPAVVWPVATCAGVLGTVGYIDGGGRPEAMSLGAAVVVTVSGLVNLVILWWAGRYLKAGYRLSRGEDRTRIQWFVSGCVAYVLGVVALSAAVSAGVLVRPDATVPITTIASVAYELVCLVAVLMVAAGVFLRGALDPSLVLKRTTVYGSLVVVAFFFFTILEGFLGDFVEGRTGLSGGVVAWVMGGLVALTVQPLHTFIHGKVERWIEGPAASHARPP